MKNSKSKGLAMTLKEKWLRHLIAYEKRQLLEEGREPNAVEMVLEELTDDSSIDEIEKIYDELIGLPTQGDYPYVEPTELDMIKEASPGYSKPESLELKGDALLEKMKGAWFGRSSGCALGKPLERVWYMQGGNGKKGWENVRVYLKAAEAWPLTTYVPDIGELDGLDVGCPDSTRDKIQFMETDDDIRYTVLGMKILEDKGRNFTTRDVAEAWFNILPMGQTFTAEREAYRGLMFSLEFGKFDEAELNEIRARRNPFREWIGAQIRADGWAYGAACQPALASEFAYRDAALSHVKNGIYGEVLFAAAIAAGFISATPLEALRRGLDYIPQKSRLHEATLQAIELGQSIQDLDELHKELWNRWGYYDGVHTINNAALVAAAIAWGADDFEKTIVCAVAGGWDTDCNGATAGSLWGATYGYSALPEKWIRPLNDKLFAAIPGFHPIGISECAERSRVLAEKLADQA